MVGAFDRDDVCEGAQWVAASVEARVTHRRGIGLLTSGKVPLEKTLMNKPGVSNPEAGRHRALRPQ